MQMYTKGQLKLHNLDQALASNLMQACKKFTPQLTHKL